MDKIDYIDFTRAYVCFGLFAWWGFWCLANGYSTYADKWGFVLSVGGLI